MKVCFMVKVSGVVQGVFYRVSAQQQAIDLALSGHAINLDNGDVEVLVCGDEHKVAQMIEWLHHGPEEARVDQVNQQQVKWQDINHFSIG